MKSSLTCGFIGLGLIGGSIAKALRKFHPDYRLIGYDIQSESTALAVKEGVLDIALSEINETFSGCDYIFLCAPVSFNDENLLKLKKFITPECLLTDVGSVKTDIHKHIEELGLGRQFIGGHPMAGSERTGYINSKAILLENAYYILTPSEEAGLDKIGRYTELVSSIGALPMILTWEEHDYITAAVSHLPHVIAASLVNLVHKLDSPDEHMKSIAAGGFKDITRIASSSPYMWQQICLENPENLSKVLDEFIRLIVQAKYLIDQKDGNGLYQMFANSREYRDSIDDTASGPIKKNYSLYCDILDETGAIATIATILSMNNINLKNIGIIHNREFDEGVLKIDFYDERAMKNAAEQLRKRNYIIYER